MFTSQRIFLLLLIFPQPFFAGVLYTTGRWLDLAQGLQLADPALSQHRVRRLLSRHLHQLKDQVNRASFLAPWEGLSLRATPCIFLQSGDWILELAIDLLLRKSHSHPFSYPNLLVTDFPFTQISRFCISMTLNVSIQMGVGWVSTPPPQP